MVDQSFSRSLRSPVELLLGGALGRGADDQPALGQLEALADRLQPLALLVLEASRDADSVAVGGVDEEAAGQRDLGRQAGALRAHRILHGLDEHLLAAGDQLLDALAVALALQLGDDDLVDVEEAVAVEADVDERGLHAGEDVVDDALVDVARDRAVRRAAEVDLGDLPVLEDGNRLLEHLDGDQDLLLDVRDDDARGRGRLARRRALALALRLGLRSLAVVEARFGFGFAWPRRRAFASASTAASRPSSCGRVRRGFRGAGARGFRSPSAVSCRAGASRSGACGSGGLGGASSPRFFQRNQVTFVDSFRAHAALGAVAGVRRAAGCLPQISYDFRAGSRLPDRAGFSVRIPLSIAAADPRPQPGEAPSAFAQRPANAG